MLIKDRFDIGLIQEILWIKTKVWYQVKYIDFEDGTFTNPLELTEEMLKIITSDKLIEVLKIGWDKGELTLRDK